MTARDAYAKYSHLDHLLSDAEWCGEDFRMSILHDLWLAVKDAAKGGDARGEEGPDEGRQEAEVLT